jgi:Zn-dependent protease with chaperone function
MRPALLALAAAMLLAGCKASLPLVAAPSAEPASAAAMAAPGAATDDELQTRQAERLQLQAVGLGMASIPVAEAYLTRLIERIQAAGPQPARPAQVLIRPKLSYNAATTRNGFIVVDLGWLKSIESEPELVALLAHEYGHLVNDHLGTKNQVGMGTYAATLAGRLMAMRLGTQNSWSMMLLNDSWSSVLMPRWSRGQEYESDAFAVDITQGLGYAHVPSVRAFLERIQSVERAARPAAKPGAPAKPVSPTAQAASEAPQPLLTDDHPPIEERIARVQKLVESRPRVRPAARSADGWRAVRDSAEFKAAEEEYSLAARLFDAVQANLSGEVAMLTRQLEQRGASLRSAAALSALAWVQPPQAIERRQALLRTAMAAPDAAFMPYQMMATLQRDQLGQPSEAVATLDAGLARFGSPPQLYPEVIDFQRTVSERINALPANQRPLALNFFGVKTQAAMTALNLRCVAQPEVAEACAWAALNAQQKQAKLAADKAKSDAMVKHATDKAENGLRKLFK